jgi:hypothetical protein
MKWDYVNKIERGSQCECGEGAVKLLRWGYYPLVVGGPSRYFIVAVASVITPQMTPEMKKA